MPVEIRTFSFPQDYPAVIALWETAGPGVHVGRSDSPAEIQKKLERDADLFLLAEEEGDLVGSVLGGFDGRRGIVYHLAVKASHRQRGLGAMLMEELENRMREKGCIKCYLLVTKDNEQAMRFYEKRGWENMDGLYIYGKNLT